LLGLILLSIFSYVILSFSNTFAAKFSWYEVYARILRSRGSIASKTLYLGDSVGGQFIPFEDNNNSLLCNGAILMTGQYILAFNAIKNNPEIDEIILLITPYELGREFRSKSVHNNFVKPFVCINNIKHFDTSVYEELNGEPGLYAYFLNFIRFLPIDEIDLNDPFTSKPDHLSEISLNYLNKLMALCNEHHIRLKLVSPPVSQRMKRAGKNWKIIRDQIEEQELESIFTDYFDGILYLEDRYFKDGRHLKPQYIDEYQEIVMYNCQQ